MLAEKLTAAVTAYLQMQIEAGVDAVQIFDSHGGLLSGNAFAGRVGRWMKQIISALKSTVPVIVFSLGTHGNWDDLVATGANVLGIDWTVSAGGLRAGCCRHTSACKAILHPRFARCHTGNRRGGNRRGFWTEMRGATRPYFQSRPRRAAGGQTGKHRRLVETVKNFK